MRLKICFLRILLIGQCVTSLLWSLNETNDSEIYTPRNRGELSSNLAKLKADFEIEKLNEAFNNVDLLFANTTIQYQKINKNENLGKVHKTKLAKFLAGPRSQKRIARILSREIKEPNILSTINYSAFGEELSLANVVKYLWQNKKINAQKAKLIYVKYSPLSSKEILHLVENGLVKTQSGFLVKLRTGKPYGEPLALFFAIESICLKYGILGGVDGLSEMSGDNLSEEFSTRGLDAHEALADGHNIMELRKHFVFISSLRVPLAFPSLNLNLDPTGFNSAVLVNPVNSLDYVLSPQTLSASLIGNYYFSQINASTSHSLFVNPVGLSYAGSLAFDGHGPDWWLFYTDGYLGAGAGYTVNFDEGAFWSNQEASFLSIGLMGGGWRDYLTVGVSMQTMLANSVGFGASAALTLSRNHTVRYLGRYPIDGKFSECRGLHKIEVHDHSAIGLSAGVAANFSSLDVPVTVAFRAEGEHVLNKAFRTHVELDKAQAMLAEDDIPGVLLILGKKIHDSTSPSFEKPDDLQVGDEILAKNIGRLSGAFIVGIESMVPIHAARVGVGLDLSGEFQLGLKRLPNNKFEVSIEPTRVMEMGLFGSVLNVAGLSHIRGLSLAKKQVFNFDFNNPQARKAYFELIYNGNLPFSAEIEISAENRGPEYLITEFRAQNEEISSQGIERTFLEKINISNSKTHAGIRAPVIPGILAIINKVDKETRSRKKRIDIQFDGVGRDFMRAHSKSVATNGIVAVRRSTFGGMSVEEQGFSGRYSKSIYVTHRRVHSLGETYLGQAENSWAFGSLILHATIEDTKITGNEENRIADLVNKYFSAYIGSFKNKNSKAPRMVNIERELTQKDLILLTENKTINRVETAAKASGIDKYRILALLDNLKNKHPDQQALMLKHFIETADGFSGFSAIHQLLGAEPIDLFVHTESGYEQAIADAKTFILMHSELSGSDDQPLIKLSASSSKENKKYIKNFYDQARYHFRTIDEMLRNLYDDQYLIDDQSTLINIIGEALVKKMVSTGARQDKTAYQTALVSLRQVLLRMMDLPAQGYTEREISKIYETAKKKRLRFEDVARHYYEKYKDPIDSSMSKHEVEEKLSHCWDFISKIEDRIYELNNDEIMKKMDPQYVDEYLVLLTDLKEKFENSASFEHLSAQDRSVLQGKFKTERKGFLGLMRRKKHNALRIEGVLKARTQCGCDNEDFASKSITHKANPKRKTQFLRGRSLNHQNNRSQDVVGRALSIEHRHDNKISFGEAFVPCLSNEAELLGDVNQ